MWQIAIPENPLWNTGRRVARVLRAAGFESYFAGGMVRDQILGRAAKDVDIATAARPDEVERLFRHVVTVGAQFGVSKVIEDGQEVEVATFRVDGPHSDGRRPDHVEWASAREDARRRDFTINGLFLDPDSGEVIDHVGGAADLDARLIRAIGNPVDRFEEDRLRMLRAVRIGSQLGFEIDPATWGAVVAMADKVRTVSAERVRDELVKLLSGADPARGLRLMKESGLLAVVLPEVAAMDGVEQPPEFHPEGDVWVHTLLLLEHGAGASLEVKLGALLHDIGKPRTFERADRIRFNAHDRVGADMTDAVLRRLRFSNEQREHVVALVQDHMKFAALPHMRKSTLKRFLAQPHIDDHLELHRIDCMASHGKLDLYDFARAKLDELRAEGIDPDPLLMGRDLLRLGYAPGPSFGRILARVRDAQLEGEVASADEARALVAREFPLP